MKLVFVETAFYSLVDPIQAPYCVISLLIKSQAFSNL
ncbi:hypothetical protein MCEWOLHM1_00025 [Candidatus Methylopumilus universalis]